MATLAELNGIASDARFSSFIGKVRVALLIKADGIFGEATPSAERLAFAQSVLQSPGSVADPFVWGVIAANNVATLDQILDATDAAIQTNVNAYVDKLHP